MVSRDSALWRRGSLVIGLVALTILLTFMVACQSSGATPSTSPTLSPSPTPTATTMAVKIANFAFDPANITVPVGTTVTWTNLDSVSHTVTSDTGVFESGTLSHNATFSYTFNSRGTFSYSCSPHPFMKGKVVVE